jgi:2,3-dihydroxybenzoate decarboxylase
MNPRTKRSREFEQTTLSAADREKIAHGNAERLLRIG